jgi:hypothetical protein
VLDKFSDNGDDPAPLVLNEAGIKAALNFATGSNDKTHIAVPSFVCAYVLS